MVTPCSDPCKCYTRRSDLHSLYFCVLFVFICVPIPIFLVFLVAFPPFGQSSLFLIVLCIIKVKSRQSSFLCISWWKCMYTIVLQSDTGTNNRLNELLSINQGTSTG